MTTVESVKGEVGPRGSRREFVISRRRQKQHAGTHRTFRRGPRICGAEWHERYSDDRGGHTASIKGIRGISAIAPKEHKFRSVFSNAICSIELDKFTATPEHEITDSPDRSFTRAAIFEESRVVDRKLDLQFAFGLEESGLVAFLEGELMQRRAGGSIHRSLSLIEFPKQPVPPVCRLDVLRARDDQLVRYVNQDLRQTLQAESHGFEAL